MRLRRASGPARLFCAALALSTLALPATSTRSALAQSAADKATARGLALEGIELFKKEKYAEALDKLQRAQQLFDAPTHLIYIARCQVKLGQIVEAAEAYRKLTRTNLGADPPQAFKDAVANAKKELPEIEPRIAGLRIDVEPSNVGGLELEIDGIAVSSVIVGVDRPSNPGKHRVLARAPGYKPAEASIELQPGEKKAISLTLESDGSATAQPPPDGGHAGEGKPNRKGEDGGKSEPPPEEPTGNIGFLLGVRVGVGIPTGQLTKDDAMKDYFGPGGGAELRAGVRIAKRYTVLLTGGLYRYEAGTKLEEVEGQRSNAEALPNGTEAGVGFVYAPPPGMMGWFAEADVLFVHNFIAHRDLDIRADPGAGTLKETCTQKLKAFGSGLRLSGGMQIPMMTWLQLSPYAGLTVGQVTDFSATDGCTNNPTHSGLNQGPWAKGGEVGDSKKTTHLVFTLGIGGNLGFGSDMPSK
jgi:hypothetical protein